MFFSLNALCFVEMSPERKILPEVKLVAKVGPKTRAQTCKPLCCTLQGPTYLCDHSVKFLFPGSFPSSPGWLLLSPAKRESANRQQQRELGP